jgi:hypothetical protein
MIGETKHGGVFTERGLGVALCCQFHHRRATKHVEDVEKRQEGDVPCL